MIAPRAKGAAHNVSPIPADLTMLRNVSKCDELRYNQIPLDLRQQASFRAWALQVVGPNRVPESALTCWYGGMRPMADIGFQSLIFCLEQIETSGEKHKRSNLRMLGKVLGLTLPAIVGTASQLPQLILSLLMA